MALPVAIAVAQGVDMVPGQSSTLLPDGRFLLLGGEHSGTPQMVATLVDPRDGARTILRGGLRHPRAWHTATLLPTGEVFVLGGVGEGGQFLGSPEILDPVTGTSSLFQMRGFDPRAFHTATLLTDGRVLIAGGRSQGNKILSSLMVWDYRTNLVTPVEGGMNRAREKHNATLLPDGRVLLRGGTDSHGAPLDSSELFDPELGRATLQQPAASPEPTEPSLHLEASIPQDGAAGVSLDSIFAFRFSHPLDPATANRQTVTLEGPDGALAANIVPAEGGMLVFVVPESGLMPGTEYQITLFGLASGTEHLPDATMSFTTAGLGFGTPETPDAGDGPQLASRGSSPALQAPAGVTALSGQVMRVNGSPLINVTLSIEGESVKTDANGRFLLSRIPDGHQILLIDGTTASTSAASYGLFQAALQLEEGKTNILPYTIWMAKLDTAHSATIQSPTKTETVLTNPLLPGLELHLPPSAVIYDLNWKPVTKIGISPIPLNRPPFPLPNVHVPIYFTIQPGGAWISVLNPKEPQGGWLIYPNTYHSAPGTHYDFWNYDATGRGWYVYGHGTVTANGKQVVPDPGVLIYGFTGAMVGSPDLAPFDAPAPGNASSADGDPVDLGTGLFVLNSTDFYIPDTIPLSLRRTYRQNDTISRAFGIGTTHLYDIFLVGDTNPWTYIDLVLPDGSQVYYKRITPGTSYSNAVYQDTSSPTIFFGSTITFNGVGWNLVLKDGTTLVFPDGIDATAPQQCALLGIVDRNGNTVQMTRDESANLLSITSPNGRWINFTYDSTNRVTQAVDNLGRTVTYTYNAAGSLASVVGLAGGKTSYTYDSSNNMLSLTDPRGIVYVQNQFDSNNRVVSQKLANGGVYKFAYKLNSSAGVVETRVTNPLGAIRTLTFNANGYTVTDVRAGGESVQQTTSYQWNIKTNLLLAFTDPLSRKTSLGYSSLGDMTSITRLSGTPQASVVSIKYDPEFHRPTSITNPLNHTYNFDHDTAGNLVEETDPLRANWTAAYNGAGEPVSLTDPLGNSTTLSYATGDLTAVSDPLLHTTTRTLDGGGRPLSSVDALGNTTYYSYDPLNRPTQTTDPLGGRMKFIYDPDGDLTGTTDPSNHSNTYAYDVLDRLISRTDPLARKESYQYDLMGNLTQFTDRRGVVVKLTYDALNRITMAQYVTGGTTTSTTTLTYDAGNRPVKIVDSRSGSITRTYDGLDDLTSETTPQGNVTYTYDLMGRRTSLTAKGQPSVHYLYDDDNHLIKETQGSATVSFAYDAAGRRLSMSVPDGVEGKYAYDAASRLTALNYAHGGTAIGDLIYAYDANDRRTNIGGSFAGFMLPDPVPSASYDAANELKHWGAATLSYDADGNLTSDGTHSYSWNDRNQLAQVLASGSATTSATFQYDGLGRRVQSLAGGSATTYLYDGINIVQEQSSDNATLLTGLSPDQIFSRTDSSGASSFLTDALGSTVALAGENGAIATQYAYSAFGNTSSTGAASSNPFQFAGREDDSTGLYNLRARYYSPALSRFISEDPYNFARLETKNLALSNSFFTNGYTYVLDSPSNYRDFSGLSPDDGFGFAVGLTAGFGIPGFGASISFGVGTDSNVGFFGYGSIGYGTYAGLSAGVGAQGTAYGNFGSFNGSGSEIGIDTPVISEAAGYGGPAAGQSPNSVSATIGPSVGGGVHYFNTSTGTWAPGSH
jgi:RHS repeat-associated protein